MMGLFTGLPGNGKTLYALNYIKALAEREKRPVFYCGINGLDTTVLPWTEIASPEEWVNLPPGAIVLIDEAQDKGFGVRMRGARMEPWIQELEKHRHHGVDIYLITQHPMLIDAHERKLIEDHFHLIRAFGLQASKVHQFQGVRDNPDKHRSGSVAVHHFKFPKAAYAWYKSAQAHTHKAKVPMKVWVLLFLVLALPVFGYLIYQRLDGMTKKADPVPSELSAPGGAPGQPPAPAPGQMLSPVEYLDRYQPRVKGLEWTAPVYDEATKPVRAPYPAACVLSKTRCTCYTQQATKMAIPDDVCQQIAKGGFFLAWDDGQGRAVVEPAKAGATAQPVNLPAATNLTPSAAIVPAAASTATQDGESIAAARRGSSR